MFSSTSNNASVENKLELLVCELLEVTIMSVFNETMRQKGQAEEDMFFAQLDLKLIAALHKKHDKEQQQVLDELPITQTYQR